jgi:hypothetical protein
MVGTRFTQRATRHVVGFVVCAEFRLAPPTSYQPISDNDHDGRCYTDTEVVENKMRRPGLVRYVPPSVHPEDKENNNPHDCDDDLRATRHQN